MTNVSRTVNFAQSATRGAGSGRSASSRTSNARRRNAGPKNLRQRAQHGKGQPKRGRGGPKRHLFLKWFAGIIGACLALGIGAFAYLYITTEIPEPEKFAMAQKTTVYFADGTTEVGSYATQNRQIISCEALPSYVGQAIVASENRTFYTDRGIDLKGIARALINNVTKGTRQGGSTITQQYAERYYMGETTTYLGKLREAIMATKIAQSESKDTVLCNYMNTIYLGRGAYGIEAAAEAYFNKDAKDLTLDEAAMLAGIIPAPSAWDPAKNAAMAEQRFNRVLEIMSEDGYITADDKANAKMPTTVENKQQNVYGGTNGYILRMVRDELTSSGTFTEDDLDTGGYKIVTTIQKDKQDLLYQSASPTANNMPDGVQAGAMSVNPKDGSILAIYGGEDYLSHQLNNATQAYYEVGSTMKPFALLTAIEQGTSLDTVFNGNSPREFDGLGTAMTNSEGKSYGYIDLYTATANSVNTVYMDMAQHLGSTFGAAQIAGTAKKAGVTGNITTEGSGAAYTVLGNDALTVKDMTQAYSTFANGGAKSTLHIVSQVLDANNENHYKAPTSTEQVFDANNVALLDKALTGVVESGTGKTLSSIGKTIAGKSGTANDAKAVSFIAFTPSMVTTIALWNPGQDGSAQVMPKIKGYSYGMGYPVTLMKTYLTQALKGVADEEFPEATDNGKVGGQDGTWGTGRRYTSSKPSTGSSTGTDGTGSTGADGQSTATAEPTTGATSSSGSSNGSTSGSGSGTHTGTSGSGSGSGSGSSNGSETGSGNGSGSNSGSESGNGNGSNSGNNSQNGSGNGNGSNSGSNNGSNSESGNNSGSESGSGNGNGSNSENGSSSGNSSQSK